VLVFTHDIEFLLGAARLAKNKAVVHVESVRRSGSVAGLRTEGFPWHAANVARRIGYLKNELVRIKPLHEDDREAYNKEVTGLYDRLRKTWERLVEEKLFRDVVRRFSPAIQTNRLREVEVTDKDFLTIEAEMAKCSKWLHDAPQSAGINLPEPGVIECDIGKLEFCAKELDERVKDTQQRRKAGDVRIEAD
jgi:hypothetical protein